MRSSVYVILPCLVCEVAFMVFLALYAASMVVQVQYLSVPLIHQLLRPRLAVEPQLAAASRVLGLRVLRMMDECQTSVRAQCVALSSAAALLSAPASRLVLTGHNICARTLRAMDQHMEVQCCSLLVSRSCGPFAFLADC